MGSGFLPQTSKSRDGYTVACEVCLTPGLVSILIFDKRQIFGGIPMAKNKPYGDNRRIGAVKSRSQFQHPDGHWVKRDADTGRIMDVKADNKPFKGVTREK